MHAAWLAHPPEPDNVARIRSRATDGEAIEAVDNIVYRHTPHGFGRSKMAEKFDAWIGVANTARNWNTVLKLAELGRAALT